MKQIKKIQNQYIYNEMDKTDNFKFYEKTRILQIKIAEIIDTLNKIIQKLNL